MLAGAAGTTSPAPGRRERATPTEGAPRCRSLCLVLTPPHTCPKSGFHYRPSNTGKVVCSKLKPRELAQLGGPPRWVRVSDAGARCMRVF